MRWATEHWLAVVNAAVGAFVAGAFVAPLLAWRGFDAAASAVYAVYHLTCHQWAFRSFFVLGSAAVLSPEQLQALGVDPYGFVGNTAIGWKMAFCERDLAIYASALIGGLLFAKWRAAVKGLSVPGYALLIVPMALDGFTQLFGWRESTWELRVITGVLFGLASVWLLYPRFDATLGLAPVDRQYAADNACAPQPRRG